MSLSHVLLTSLLEQPSTGFELARRFDRSMGYFWNASHQQIYRELNQMLAKGWISTLDDSNDQGRKKTYQVEQSGRIELTQWLSAQSEPAQLREDLMVRLRADAQLHNHQVIDELKRHLLIHQSKLNTYEHIYQKDFYQPAALDRTLFIHKKILELGIDLEKNWIKWLEDLIPELERFECDANKLK